MRRLQDLIQQQAAELRQSGKSVQALEKLAAQRQQRIEQLEARLKQYEPVPRPQRRSGRPTRNKRPARSGTAWTTKRNEINHTHAPKAAAVENRALKRSSKRNGGSSFIRKAKLPNHTAGTERESGEWRVESRELRVTISCSPYSRLSTLNSAETANMASSGRSSRPFGCRSWACRGTRPEP